MEKSERLFQKTFSKLDIANAYNLHKYEAYSLDDLNRRPFRPFLNQISREIEIENASK